ncbi:hypothetical protein BRC86_06465 [Halobacteriales archaeon QS_3_64_16]|nr:MAG: hypothetical protein BRC86_06465 [Halobacteriales archaeon QS_3_64_16]
MTDRGSLAGALAAAPSRGRLLIGAGLLLLVGTLTISAALAPAIGSPAPAGERNGTLTLVGSQGGGPGWHQYGSVYLLNGSDVVWREASAESYFDVTRTGNGTILAGFMEGGYESCGEYDSPCVRTGFRAIDPRSTRPTRKPPRVIAEYSFPVRTRSNSEVHDVERLESDEYLLTDMDTERIFTVQDGEITWQWSASAFYDAPPDPTRTDWLHINDVDVIEEGRYLVSVRNANQLLIIERGEGVVEVINEDGTDRNDASCQGSGQLRDTDRDGNVRCGDPAILDHQHNPQFLEKGAILVADSENDRVVELHEEDGEWTVAWSLDRTGDVALSWPRDADRLSNGNTLITDTLNKRIVEVNESGAAIRSYETDRIPYEADRLPVGEPVGGPTYDDTAAVGERRAGSSVPVLSTLLVGVQAVYPALPFWFGEGQLLLTLLALGLLAGGTVLGVRERVGPDH